MKYIDIFHYGDEEQIAKFLSSIFIAIMNKTIKMSFPNSTYKFDSEHSNFTEYFKELLLKDIGEK